MWLSIKVFISVYFLNIAFITVHCSWSFSHHSHVMSCTSARFLFLHLSQRPNLRLVFEKKKKAKLKYKWKIITIKEKSLSLSVCVSVCVWGGDTALPFLFFPGCLVTIQSPHSVELCVWMLLQLKSAWEPPPSPPPCKYPPLTSFSSLLLLPSLPLSHPPAAPLPLPAASSLPLALSPPTHGSPRPRG